MAEEEPDGDRISDDGMDELSQKLALFQEITGINDTAQCQSTLEIHQWNVEAAVQDAFNAREGMQPVFNPPPPPLLPPAVPIVTTRPLPTNASVITTLQRRSQVATRVGWFQWFLGIGFLPFRWVLSLTNELYQTLVGLIFGPQPLTSSDPVRDVQQFITHFEEQYGTDHPAFLNCSYGDALEKAKKELKYLLIYLHSSGHGDTPSFCRDVLTCQRFNDALSSRDCLFWAVAIDSEEGARVSYILRETRYPFLALVMLRGSRMTVINRIEGYGIVDNIVEKIQQVMSHNEPELVVLRTERNQRDQDQRLRQEQEEEFLRSLKADQEKARRKEEEMNQVARMAELERQKEEERKKRAQDFERERQVRAARLPVEPTEDSPSIVHISVKMLDGQRIERKFHNTDQLQSLYDFAYSYNDIPKSFTLFTSYPKRELLCNDNGGPTLQELNFSRKVLVFVQNTTEDDE